MILFLVTMILIVLAIFLYNIYLSRFDEIEKMQSAEEMFQKTVRGKQANKVHDLNRHLDDIKDKMVATALKGRETKLIYPVWFQCELFTIKEFEEMLEDHLGRLGYKIEKETRWNDGTFINWIISWGKEE